ncbi:MAG: polyprenyl synthetase family protein [Bacteroidales bacterium]
MNKMQTLDRIKDPVSNELKEFERQFKNYVKSDINFLNIILNYIIRTKGKQIRPLLVMLSAKMHGTTGKSTIIAASLIELLHTATLIHDDVVDDSYERRGFFSINALWKSKVAVLLGDFLLSKGLLLSVDNEEFDQLKIVATAVREMSEGELMQIQKSRKLDIKESEYFEIIRKKTATLMAACCACGAKSVGADSVQVENMWKFGEFLGIAFQIKDDLLDFDHHGITGKPIGNDIREKKITLPLIYSLEMNAQGNEKKIRQIIGKKNKTNNEVNEIIKFIKDSGGIGYATDLMNDFKNKALAILSEYPEGPALESLKNLASFIIERKK